ncbi:MAG: DUF72 domain-containing protein [Kofleriaceae bacterium]|nr:DUF72 domain-containing protein [Kofleriaceae bacterium]
MEFGRLRELSGVDFSLPTMEDALFGSQLKSTSDAELPTLYLGAPVWAHKSFVGKIYPPKSKPDDYLSLYAKSFNCIELNSTFYGVLGAERVAKWCDKVGPEFRFCPKATRAITHESQQLPRQAILDFFNSVREFGDNLGTCFLQFPPEFGPRQWQHLQSLLKLLPKEFQVAIELRHPGWFDRKKALQWLLKLGEQFRVSILITDTAGRRDVLHHSFPQPHAFVRFSGDGLVASDFERLDQWTTRLAELSRRGVKELYFILHQEQEGRCVELAEHLIARLPEAGLPPILRVQEQEQLKLW